MESAKPGRRGVTRDDVWRASDALLVEGLRPTVEKVRQRLGGGSPNTVGPHLDSWFQGLGRRIANPGAFAEQTSAKSHPEPVAQAADFLWRAAQTEARRVLDEEYSKQFAELERGRGDLEQERQQLEAARLAMKQLVETVEQKLETASAARDQAVAQVARLEERVLALEGELARSAADKERLQAKLEHQKTLVLDAEHRARDERLAWVQEREGLAATAEAARRGYMLELDDVRTQLKRAQSQRDTQVREAGQARELLVTELARKSTEVTLLEGHLAELGAEVARLQRLQERSLEHERPARRHSAIRPARPPAPVRRTVRGAR